MRVSHPIALTALFGLSAFEGLAALAASFMTSSEPGSALIFGLSPVRLAITGATILMIVSFLLAAWAERTQPGWWKRTATIASRVTGSPGWTFTFFCVLFALFLAILGVLFLFLSPLRREWSLLLPLSSRLGPLLICTALIVIQFGIFLLVDGRTRAQMRKLSKQLVAGTLLGISTLIYTVFLKIYLSGTWDARFKGVEGYIFIPALVLLAWHFSRQILARKSERISALVEQLMMLLFIGATVGVIYWHTAQWFRFETTRNAATWHLVAKAFLEGKLYLENPVSTHDLTFSNGHWFVPVPPLPALVVLPFVALFGVEKVNMVHVSILAGALNAMLVYLILSKAGRLRMIPASIPGMLWLTVLFAFGTTHWWLSVYGIFWYLNQLLTLFFTALAILFTLYKASPWLIGLCLGLALLSRPNGFTLWPLLLGITFFLEQQTLGAIPWKRMFTWALKTAVPMAACAGALLLYNYMRFGSFLDFGYVTINSSTWIMEAVRRYGMFNIHFVPINFEMMFLRMPFLGIVENRLYYSPTFEGTSIFAMTPAVVYLFRRFRFNWWTIGAWVSISFTAGLLLLYHNTGSWQIGYRYLMDFILPVLLLMGIGIGQRTSRLFILLTLISVVINGAGVAWWFMYM